MDVENQIWQEMVLSREEYKFLVEILDGPPEPPSEYSIKAHEEYREMVRNGTLTIVD